MKDDDLARNYHRSGSRSRSSRIRKARRKGLWIFFATMVVVVAAVGAGLSLLADSESASVVAARTAAADAGRKPIERTAALAPLNLPADDAPHGSAMEWWYYNGILDAAAGQRYAFHIAVFVANGLVKHTVMHAALIDLQTGKRYASQTRTGGIPIASSASGFDFRQDGWQVAASGPAHLLRVAFEGASLALDLKDAQPPVAHRAADSATPGLLDFGSSGISYYYSRPRIAAQGEISVGGKTQAVSGAVWFDHQWGEFDVLTLGWNWFALHLADGSDLMLYQLFDMDGRKVMTAGTVSNAKGSAPLKAGEVELIPGGTWTSPKTGITYVVEWGVKTPAGLLNVKPYFPDGEFDSSRTTANIYWEGPVKVTGSSGGEGFLELSGYDRVKAKPAVRN
ncbi:lipocalin family protein [Variovorax saccharolyticus]|uniref:lipocalin family protein n=1 Tax=Variovorax saccharolyticus TaxID=3053516 RepID=UPI0025789714|nr:lipocalin family protein [Variovorax sp. J31P216]MDM0029428.1 lipocalin family protein [Variovorax sp. J31P216]